MSDTEITKILGIPSRITLRLNGHEKEHVGVIDVSKSGNYWARIGNGAQVIYPSQVVSCEPLEAVK